MRGQGLVTGLLLYSLSVFNPPTLLAEEASNALKAVHLDEKVDIEQIYLNLSNSCQQGKDYAKIHYIKAFKGDETTKKMKKKVDKNFKLLGLTRYKPSSKNYFSFSSTGFFRNESGNYTCTTSLVDALSFECDNTRHFIESMLAMNYGCKKFYGIDVCKFPLK